MFIFISINENFIAHLDYVSLLVFLIYCASKIRNCAYRVGNAIPKQYLGCLPYRRSRRRNLRLRDSRDRSGHRASYSLTFVSFEGELEGACLNQTKGGGCDHEQDAPPQRRHRGPALKQSRVIN